MVQIDYSRDDLLSEFAKQTMKERYMLPEEKSPQEAFARAAEAFADDAQHAQRLYDAASKHWFMFASPVLANGGSKRGLPISCFLNYVPDSRQGLTDHYTETAWLSTVGGGVGGYWGDVRSDGEATSNGSGSSGSIPFIGVIDRIVLAFRQGKTRRASYAAYTDISHPEIEEFLYIRKPTGGDANRKSLNIHHGVNITDEFMEAVRENSNWELVDPNSGQVTKTVPARSLWERILTLRLETGEPYIFFIDAANRQAPEGSLPIRQSNLCTEITLATNDERTAVCCLSSLNLEKWHEWEGTRLVEDITRMLDNVLTYFIENAPPALERAVRSAAAERSIGIGAMGFHSFLQAAEIPMDSVMARVWSDSMFRKIKQRAVSESVLLAEERGIPEDCRKVRRRNLNLLAIAPNASSSILCGGTSPGIEPWPSNAYIHKTLNGSVLINNKHLERVLEQHGQNTQEVWMDIVTNDGSVQHLPFLTETEKEVFKTAWEIDQGWLIDLAFVRQHYICQSQSLNLFFTPDVNAKYLNKVHLRAWEAGLKSLYYVRSKSLRRAEAINRKIERQFIETESDCLACEG